MTRPPRAQLLAIAGPAGRLEALIEAPEGPPPASFGVVCHPHPLHGGTLHNKVVHTLARALHDFGVPTVRFNYRGVGTSEGGYNDGLGETEDALAVIDWARQRWPAAAPWLLGFSFGGVIAIRAAARAGAKLLVTVAPAVTRMAVDAVPSCPWLIVQGDADEVIDPSSVLEWASGQAPVLRAASLRAARVRVLHGVGHFFHGRLPELREAVASFIRESGSFAKESGAQPVG